MSELRVGDRVKVVADEERLRHMVVDKVEVLSLPGTITKIAKGDLSFYVDFGEPIGGYWFTKGDLAQVSEPPFSIGNKVKVIADKERLKWLMIYEPEILSTIGVVDDVMDNGQSVHVDFGKLVGRYWLGRKDLVHVLDRSDADDVPKFNNVRVFDSGATRDSDAGKLDVEGFLSPVVLLQYCKYMHKHRKQADGKLRDSDNWQMLFGEKHYDVCAKSLTRHFFEFWQAHRAEKRNPEKLVEILCAVFFNVNAYLYKLLKECSEEEIKIDRTAPKKGGY